MCGKDARSRVSKGNEKKGGGRRIAESVKPNECESVREDRLLIKRHDSVAENESRFEPFLSFFPTTLYTFIGVALQKCSPKCLMEKSSSNLGLFCS